MKRAGDQAPAQYFGIAFEDRSSLGHERLDLLLGRFRLCGLYLLGRLRICLCGFPGGIGLLPSNLLCLDWRISVGFSATALSVAKTGIVAGAKDMTASASVAAAVIALLMGKSCKGMGPARPATTREAAHGMPLAFAHLCKETKTNVIYFISIKFALKTFSIKLWRRFQKRFTMSVASVCPILPVRPGACQTCRTIYRSECQQACSCVRADLQATHSRAW